MSPGVSIKIRWRWITWQVSFTMYPRRYVRVEYYECVIHRYAYGNVFDCGQSAQCSCALNIEFHGYCLLEIMTLRDYAIYRNRLEQRPNNRSIHWCHDIQATYTNENVCAITPLCAELRELSFLAIELREISIGLPNQPYEIDCSEWNYSKSFVELQNPFFIIYFVQIFSHNLWDRKYSLTFYVINESR